MTEERPEFTFFEHVNTPYEGCTMFVSSFSQAMRDSPTCRPAYCPIVDEITAWCVERFGPSSNKTQWDFSSMGVFYFDDPMMGFEFKMRWC
jgi:hypothetical protein